jgi:hypothetical protein
MKNRILLALGVLACCFSNLLAQSTIRQHEYWIDDNYGQKVVVSSTNAIQTYSVDLSNLSIGTHYFNHRSQDSNGHWGAMTRNVFYLQNTDEGLSETVAALAGYEYWLDDDYAHKTFVASTKEENNFEVDLSALSEGTHYFSFRSTNKDGRWGAISRSAFFMRASDEEMKETLSPLAGYEYWLDNDYDKRTYKKSSSANIVASIQLEGLKSGVHSLNFRAHNEAGRWGAMSRNIFYMHEAELKNDEGAKIIGYRYQFGGQSKYVAITPCAEYALNNKILSMPEFTEYASLDEGCTYEFSGTKIILHRDNKSVFSLQFENENHKWSNPATLELEVNDELTRTVTELRPQSSVTLNKVGCGDFNAIKINITETDNYYFKATQPCRIDLYTEDGILYQTLDEQSLLTLCEAGLLEGTYYGIVRDHKTNGEYSANEVTIRMLLTEGVTPNPEFSFTDSLLTITSMDGAKIYYTLDGTTPTVSSALYTAPIKLERNCTVKAVAKHPDLAISDVGTYKIDVFKVAKPEVLFANLKLYMSCPTPYARLYYTTDGSDPVANGILYNDPVTIDHNATIKIVGKRDGYNDSDILDYALDLDNVTCIQPEFQREGNQLTLTSLTEGVSIYYTLDGEDPTSTYELYNGTITLTHNGLVKAYASKEGLLNSETASYLVDWFQTDIPEFSFEDNMLTIKCSTKGSTIYYVLGDGIPSRDSEKYVQPIALNDNRSVKAIAVADGFKDSEIATYNPDMFSCETPQLSYDGRAITMTTATQGATIYYTVDGTNPTENSNRYAGSTILNGICTIRAIAIKENMNNSMVNTMVLPCYYNGGNVYVETPGKMNEAFAWCGGMPEFESLTVCGKLNATDISLIRNSHGVKFLDLSEVTIDELQDESFADMNLVSIAFPSVRFNVGKRLLVGCNELAAIEWNSTNKIPEDILGDIKMPNILLYVKNANYANGVFGNVIVGNSAESIILQDSKTSNFYCPHEFTAHKITYTHNYAQKTESGKCTGWETIALPFTPTAIVHNANGSMAPFAANDATKKPFWLCELTESGFVNSNALMANTPYIIAMPNNIHYADEYILAGNVTFEGSNVKVLASLELNYGSKGGKTFVPNFMNIDKDECMTLNVGETYNGYAMGSMFVQSLRNASPFEAYITMDGLQSMARQTFSIEDIESTGFEDVESFDIDINVDIAEKSILVRGTGKGDNICVYNISGEMLSSTIAANNRVQIKNLPSGIFILVAKRNGVIITTRKFNL